MARVGPEKVEAAKSRDRVTHDAAGKRFVGQVPCKRNGLAACGGDFIHYKLRLCGVEVDHRNARAFSRKPQRARAAHAGCCRGDDADLVLEPHGVSCFGRILKNWIFRSSPG